MFYSICYELALVVLAFISLPKLFYQMFVYKKYRKSFLKRLGFGFPHIEKGNRKLIWIHAVSVGETKAVAKLARELKNSPANPILVISSITETGHSEALKSLPFADHHVFLPFDFMWIVYPILRRISPDLVILCETDFWYNFLQSAKSRGASIAVVNAKISKQSLQRFKQLRLFANQLFKIIDLFCLQSEDYKKRFTELNIPDNKLIVTGNLKFDDDPVKLTDEEREALKKTLRIGNNDKILVIGSSHHPEEQQLLEELKKIWQAKPQLKVLVVPRHPERFNEVAQLLEKSRIPFIRYSNPENGPDHYKVLLVDAMGVLRKCYQIANTAIVAGSYTSKVGGHNILEPLWYGVPVIYGPHMHSQPELLDLAKAYGAGLQVPVEEVNAAVGKLIDGGPEALRMASAGLKLVMDARGSTERTFRQLGSSFADFFGNPRNCYCSKMPE